MPFKEAGTTVTWANPQFVPESQRENGGWYYNPDTNRVDRWWSDGGSSSQNSTGSLEQEAEDRMVNDTADLISEYLDKLNRADNITFSDEELQNFLDKATAEVQPYYDKRLAEIKTGIQEGQIQDAEDLLIALRRSKDEVEMSLKKYDLEEAQTEEEFINTLAQITSQEGEDLELSRLNWRDRVNQARNQQVQKGIQTSGIGKQETATLNQRADIEQSGIARRADEKQLALETGKKYSLENIALAREAVQRERVRKYGTEDEATALEQGLKDRAGVEGDDFSEIGLLSNRAKRNVTAYKPEALTQTEEERKRAIESRKLRLQEEERLAKSARLRSEATNLRMSNSNLNNYLNNN